MNMLFRFVVFFSAMFVMQKGLSQFQDLGELSVVPFQKEVYSGGTQNWDISCSPKGYVAVANNSGLLLYDGTKWELLHTPVRTIIRSVEIMEDSRKIFVGGQNEFGYFFWDKGKYTYHDLRNRLLAPEESLEDIWEMESLSSTIYFRSQKNILYVYLNDTITQLNAPANISAIARVGDKMVVATYGKGLFYVTGKTLSPYIQDPVLAEKNIIEIVPVNKDSTVLATLNHGLFVVANGRVSRLLSNADNFLIKNQILAACINPVSGDLIVGTAYGGTAILSRDFRTRHLVNITNGLINNTVSTVRADAAGNIWLGTYNGLYKILHSQSGKVYYPDGNLKGAIYGMALHGDNFYFATATGLYRLGKKDYYDPLTLHKPELVPQTNGQCWGLDVIEDKLILCHHTGAYEIGEDKQMRKLSGTPGIWKFLKINDTVAVSGTYTGIEIYRKKDGRWQLHTHPAGWAESSRILVFDKYKNLWVSHPYKGIFRITFTTGYKDIRVDTISREQGIPYLYNCYGHNIADELYVSNDSTTFRYDYLQKKFFPAEQINAVMKDESLKRIYKFGDNYWYIGGKTAGVLQFRQDRTITKKVYSSDGNLFVGGFEFCYAMDSTMIAATDKGIRIFGLENSQHFNDQRPHVYRFSVMHPRDSTLATAWTGMALPIHLSHQENSLSIDFCVPHDDAASPRFLYSCMLAGYDDTWSEWMTATNVVYKNLPFGQYSFAVRARPVNGENITESTTLEINIAPPWYKSLAARLGYFLMFCMLIVLIVKLSTKRLKTENASILKEKESTENELKDLKNERLEQEIEFKNKELATVTMHLMQKSQTISQIGAEVEKVSSRLKDADARSEVKKLLSIIHSDSRVEDDWNSFAWHFDQVHHDFLQRLKALHPSLSANDLKLSAYLRMNLTTKEIAPLMNISVRGVEISRYRLRRKLDLENNINLNEYMMTF